MRPPFEPFVRNPHLLTIAGNFWPRRVDTGRFPATRRTYQPDAQNSVIAFEHQPPDSARAQIITLHGLEGSAEAGYIASLCQEALIRGYGVHRLNLRTCGGTEELCATMYHSGLTGDTRFVIKQLQSRFSEPVFLVGFSLGGNVALKLAGELGNSHLLSGVAAISTPIDLAASVRTLDKPTNVLYAHRFLDRLRARIRRKSRLSPHLYTTEGLDAVRTIWEFDDRFTAPLFGFGTAANYYATQSALRFMDEIRIPSLLIAAMDDPLVPFESYQNYFCQTKSPGMTVSRKGQVELLATEHGGHLGFVSRKRPRFWVDGVVLDYFDGILARIPGTNVENLTSA